MDERRRDPLLYPTNRSMRFTAQITLFVTVFVLGCIFALVCAAMAYNVAKPMSVNFQAIHELGMKSKLKAVQGANPEKTLEEYLEARGRHDGVEDASNYPPHPALLDMMNLTVKGNKWNVPSETKERNSRFESHDLAANRSSSLLVPEHHIDRLSEATIEKSNKYLDAVSGKKFRQRMVNLKDNIEKDDTELYDSLFGVHDIYHHSASGVSGDAPPPPPSTSEGHDEDVDILAYNTGGYCSNPVPLKEGQTCTSVCYTSRAVRVMTPFVAGGTFITHKSGEDPKPYCWSGNVPGDHIETSPTTGERVVKECSVHTSIVVLTDDGGWQCRPKYPTYFGGSGGTSMTACAFNPSTHKGPPPPSSSTPIYYDVLKKQQIRNHTEFRNSSYISKLRQSSSLAEFKIKCNDPEFLYKNPITCFCNNKKDVLNNDLLSQNVTKDMKFRGMYECMENPCVMMPNIDPSFVTFDVSTMKCVPGVNNPQDSNRHAIIGDDRTPLVGTVPAMGIFLADQSKRGDQIHQQRPKSSIDETTAKKIALAQAPIITPLNLDATNTSKNVLFVPIPSTVLPPLENIPHVIIRPSSLLHRSCLAPVLNKPSSGQHRPFCTAPFYIEPAANVLAGNIPQKPYEHSMLATECLRNSRMVSGSVHGGSELLFSTLLSQNKPSSYIRTPPGGTPAPEYNSTGDQRLEEIRDFFERNFNDERRLSQTEYVIKKHARGMRTSEIYLKSSSWDSLMKRKEFLRHIIKKSEDTFVLKEGLLMRSYGPYAATVLARDMFDLDYLKGKPASKTSSTLKVSNPLQYAFPTSYSVLPEEGATDDIFSVDHNRIFDSETIPSYFDCSNVTPGSEKLFGTSSSSSEYRVDIDDDAWGLQSFRLDHNPKSGPVVQSDPRLAFDASNISSTPEGATITPLSLFKKSLVEWGHKKADVQETSWFRDGVDTSEAYRRLLVETSMAVRNSWFSLAWENKNYYFAKNSS